MKKALITMIAMIVIIFSGGVLWAEQTNYDIGKVVAPELKLGLGARPVALGEAYVALADDLNATAWNPAGLSRITGAQAGFMHNIFIQETLLEYVAFAYQLFPGAGLGANVFYFNYGSIKKVDFDGVVPEVVGEFNPSALILSLGYGQQVLETLSLGATVKYYSQNIDTKNYSAVVFDIGGLLQTGVEKLTIGLAVQNLGAQVAGKNLPMNVKAGAAYGIPILMNSGDSWNVLLDVNVPFGDTNYSSANIGTEYWYNNMIAVRVGYKIKDAGELGGVTGLTAGLGAKLSVINLDYAMVSYGDLGLTHQMAIGVSF
ncbi:PorV/PorQ family protein [bacterium]|nr:PorV/PorQ family protein [bacterium]